MRTSVYIPIETLPTVAKALANVNRRADVGVDSSHDVEKERIGTTAFQRLDAIGEFDESDAAGLASIDVESADLMLFLIEYGHRYGRHLSGGNLIRIGMCRREMNDIISPQPRF